jgi:glycosyltransferase involved in cell wall biosynthesis/ubiquinone/menaquinone biosynthesis C-methylase UbiE
MDKTVARQDSEVPGATRHPGAPLRVLHVISGLGLGGAETVLFRLATRSKGIEHEVICLGPRNWYSDLLEERGIRVHHVEFSSLARVPAAARRLLHLIRASAADVVQGWMYRGNVMGGLSARVAGKPVVWNVRSSTLGPLRPGSRILAKIGGPLARWVPEYVINCSRESARLHARFGYDRAKGGIIPNGYDPERFRPDEEARSATRASLGVEPGTFLICTIGRWHAQKGFPELLDALRLLRERNVAVRLLMVGLDLDERNLELEKLVDRSGCRRIVQMIGQRADILDIARAPDLHVLASIGVEAFPNVVAETMLSGTPNVVTDVGDAAFIVGDTGWVVAPGHPEQLADAIQQAYAEWANSPESWRKRREAARKRIAENFTIEAMVAAYEDVWRQVARAKSPAAAPASQPLPGNVDAKTIAGFGREWDQFDQSKLVGEEYDDLFAASFGIFPFEDLPPAAEGFDLGCGSGRWAAGVAPRVGKLHLIDPAEQALDVARKRLDGVGNVSFHLASADAIPLPDASQDFGYSLGVLHHIPNTARALADAVRKLKPGAPFLLYIYYNLENRPAWFRFLWRGSDALRRLVSRLPFPVVRGVTSAIAAIVYWPLARLSLVAEKTGRDPSAIPLGAYHDRSFYTMRTDALDRFGTRLEQRFTRGEIEQMMRDAGLTQIRFSDRMPYWVACGTREHEPSTPTNSSESDRVTACD